MGPAAAAGHSAAGGRAAAAPLRLVSAHETGTDGDRERRVKSLLLRDESRTLEFKSWPASRPGAPHDSSGMEENIARALCSLANTEGGDLLVGVGDGGEVEGLATGGGRLSRKERDDMLLWLTNVIVDYFRVVVYDGLFDCAIVEVGGRDILHCAVDASKDGPVILKKRLKGKHEFFVRAGSSCRAPDSSEMVEYVRTKWPGWDPRPPMGQYSMTGWGSYADIVAMGGGGQSLWSEGM